ncbi:MAG: TetR family transcriptional regulator [Methylobacterium sp.]|nr:MAG: TetR family transcriptional regulator [Methylobacterium sp.]
MPPRVGQKEETRQRIVEGAGRGFRAHGYGGIGVDGLAREAAVTSGAFYANFKSKAAAFREVVATGLDELRDGILMMRGRFGTHWREKFVDFYLGERRTCDLAESCALQSLTNEVARADPDIRAIYEEKLRAIIDSTADGLAGDTVRSRRDESIALLALLIGGVSLARGVNDEALGNEIAKAVREAAQQLEDKNQGAKAKPRRA